MGPHAIKPVVAAPTRALPELRSDQVRTRRCNCNGHNTARALGCTCTLQLGVADSPPSTTGRQAQIMQQDPPMHDNVRARTGRSLSFSSRFLARRRKREQEGRARKILTQSSRPPSFSRKGQARNKQGLSLSCLAKKSRWFLSSSSPSLTCPPRSSSLCLVLFTPSV
jgi:hypothetical protein